MSDSLPGRVSPEDLEAMRRTPGCGMTEFWDEAHDIAAEWWRGCNACASLLYLAIASRVESATIERCAAEVEYIVEPNYYLAVDIRGLPRLYAEDK